MPVFGEREREKIEETILRLVPTLHFLLQKVQARQPPQHKVANGLKVNGRKEERSRAALHHSPSLPGGAEARHDVNCP